MRRTDSVPSRDEMPMWRGTTNTELERIKKISIMIIIGDGKYRNSSNEKGIFIYIALHQQYLGKCADSHASLFVHINCIIYGHVPGIRPLRNNLTIVYFNILSKTTIFSSKKNPHLTPSSSDDKIDGISHLM